MYSEIQFDDTIDKDTVEVIRRNISFDIDSSWVKLSRWGNAIEIEEDLSVQDIMVILGVLEEFKAIDHVDDIRFNSQE